MKNYVVVFLMFIFLLAGMVSAQELVIKDFPLGKGMSYVDSIKVKYGDALQQYADTIKADSTVDIELTGSADGYTYIEEQDANNAATSLSRVHGVKWLLINVYGVDSTRIRQTTGESLKQTGDDRSVIVNVVPRYATINDLNKIISMIPDVPKTVTCTTYVYDTTVSTSTVQALLGSLRFGISTIPKADVIFIVQAKLSLDERLALFGTFGHSLVNNEKSDIQNNLVDATAMLTSVGVTYLLWEKEQTDSTMFKTFSLSVLLTQMQNDKNFNDTHLWKRRAIEVGPMFEIGPVAVSIYGNYGKTKNVRSPSVHWNSGGRLELTVKPF